MTIYLPDDLGERVKDTDINVSKVCQKALAAELDRTTLVDLTKMHRVELFDAGRESDVAFTGALIAENSKYDTVVYRTANGRLAVYDHEYQRLYDFDDFVDFAAAGVVDQDLVADTANALDEPYVMELDI